MLPNVTHSVDHVIVFAEQVATGFFWGEVTLEASFTVEAEDESVLKLWSPRVPWVNKHTAASSEETYFVFDFADADTRDEWLLALSAARLKAIWGELPSLAVDEIGSNHRQLRFDLSAPRQFLVCYVRATDDEALEVSIEDQPGDGGAGGPPPCAYLLTIARPGPLPLDGAGLGVSGLAKAAGGSSVAYVVYVCVRLVLCVRLSNLFAWRSVREFDSVTPVQTVVNPPPFFPSHQPIL